MSAYYWLRRWRCHMFGHQWMLPRPDAVERTCVRKPCQGMVYTR